MVKTWTVQELGGPCPGIVVRIYGMSAALAWVTGHEGHGEG